SDQHRKRRQAQSEQLNEKALQRRRQTVRQHHAAFEKSLYQRGEPEQRAENDRSPQDVQRRNARIAIRKAQLVQRVFDVAKHAQYVECSQRPRREEDDSGPKGIAHDLRQQLDDNPRGKQRHSSIDDARPETTTAAGQRAKPKQQQPQTRTRNG